MSKKNKLTGEHGISEKVVIETRKRFDRKRWEEIKKNPPEYLEKYDGTKFRMHPHVIEKMCNGIFELIFKNQDIKMKISGGEGTGKTTHATQYGQLFYWILNECNCLHKDLGTYYEYTEEECLAHNIDEYNEMSDRLQNKVFRILICDEAGSLKATNRFDRNNRDFSEKMRKDRKTLKIEILCYPNVWELNKDSVLDRTNCIVLCETSEEDFGLGAIPDVAKLIIIPRGQDTFSYHSMNKISKADMKEMLGEVIKNKYITTIQNKYVYQTYKRDDVFCFDAQKYLARAKEKGKINEGLGKFELRDSELSIFAYLIEKGVFTPKKIGLGTVQEIPEGVSLEEKKRIHKINDMVNVFGVMKTRMKKHLVAVSEYNYKMGIEEEEEDQEEMKSKENTIEDKDFKNLYDSV